MIDPDNRAPKPPHLADDGLRTLALYLRELAEWQCSQRAAAPLPDPVQKKVSRYARYKLRRWRAAHRGEKR